MRKIKLGGKTGPERGRECQKVGVGEEGPPHTHTDFLDKDLQEMRECALQLSGGRAFHTEAMINTGACLCT